MLNTTNQNKRPHESLLEYSSKQLFPNSQFEANFKKGECHDTQFLKRDYAVRLASIQDIDSLMELERQCWSVPMQMDQLEVEKWIQDGSCFVFVLEYNGEVIGVNYTQRVRESDIKNIRGKTVAQYRVQSGDIIQLIALNILPIHQDKGWGNEMLEFVLQLASLFSEIKKVYAITRCRDFHKSGYNTVQDYLVNIYRDGEFNDPILKFHQMHGAKVLGLVKNYRPYDVENQGYGVMIRYDIGERPWKGSSSNKTLSKNLEDPSKQLLEWLQRKLNNPKLDHSRKVTELGIDSLDSAELIVFMQDKLGEDIQISDLNKKSLKEILQQCDGRETLQLEVETPTDIKKRIRSLIRQFPELVPLSLQNTGPCTFWIHPLSGDVGIYNMIASQTDGAFSIVAIKSRGFLSRDNKPLTSVEEMANYYCEIVKQVQPDGPYRIAGFSFGGTVAYEMVNQLQKNGKKVEALLLVESPIITDNKLELFETSYRNNLLMNANFLLLTLLNREQNLVKRLDDGLVDWNYYTITDQDVINIADEQLLPHIVHLCKQKGIKQADDEIEFKLVSMSEVHISNLEAIQKYRAQKLTRPQDVKVWMFRTETARAISNTFWNPDYLVKIQNEMGSILPLLEGWEHLLPQMQTIVLEGENHFDILHSKTSIKKFYSHCKQIFTTSSLPSGSANIKGHSGDKNPLTTPIAIVGMSGKFPDAENVHELWENLQEGRNSVKQAPSDRGWNIEDYFDPKPQTPGKTYSKWGGFLSDIDKFDSLFFKISPKDAELMDPSERIFIQEAWKAIEDAGYNPRSLSGSQWGVFASAKSDYSITIQKHIESFYLPTDSYSAARLSYLLNLVGPAMTIDTACSSTLSVVVEACNSLVLGECEAAIVGGGAVYTTPNILIGSSQSLLFSPDGQCFTFDNRANGTVVAEAIGAVVLKKLDKAIEDNDHVYGVIRGWGLNQDGKTNGITAPSGQAQSRLHTSVYEKFGINPEHITMVEAHGTGTQLGDAIEYQALKDTFSKYTTKKNYCALGSLKTNIGHAFLGSGIAGLIKVSLSIKNGKIPPSLNYNKASEKIEENDSPFFINTTLRDWETQSGQPRCAAINAFGATGTNAHVVVEQYLNEETKVQVHSSQPSVIIVLSAKNENQLKDYTREFLKLLDKGFYKDEHLVDMAYTYQVGREHMAVRLAFLTSSINELKEQLSNYQNNHAFEENVCRGKSTGKSNGSSQRASNEQVQDAIEQWLKFKEAHKLLELWVKGAAINWEKLYTSLRPNRISLPGYQFAKDRCWINDNNEGNNSGSSSTAPRKANSTKQVPASNSSEFEEPYELQFYTEQWEKAPLADTPEFDVKTLVCFLSDAENKNLMRQQLKERNPESNLIFIAKGNAYQKLDSENYVISKEDKGTYQTVFKDILENNHEITSILYLWAYEDTQCIKEYNRIVYILQAMAGQKTQAQRLVLAAPYANPIERCYLDSWIGFERSIGTMMLSAKVKVVIQELTSNKEGLTNDILNQLLSEVPQTSTPRSILFEQNTRHQYKTQEAENTAQEREQKIPLKNKGTYLITGGLGKLGLIFAKHLAKNYHANLILTGRTEIDSKKRKSIQELENLGGRVYYLQSDVSSKQGMEKGIGEAINQFGEVNGVIHAAGIVEPNGLFEKTVEEFEKVIQPKIQGTLLLDELLSNRNPDFVCYFSSAAAILGDFGSCDYSVGNRFQMAYAQHKNKSPEHRSKGTKAVVVNWPVWKDGGMDLAPEETQRYLRSSGQRYLEQHEGITVFEQLLTQDQTQVLVMAGQKSKLQLFLKLDHIGNKEPLQPKKIPSSTPGVPALEESDLNLVRQHLETEIKSLISELHGIPTEKLDIGEHLMDYGFDSINILEFSRQLSRTFEVELTPASLLSYATVEKIIEHLIEEHQMLIMKYYNKKTGQSNQLGQSEAVIQENQTKQQEVEKPGAINSDMAISLNQVQEPIAVIGMSGRFPQADTVNSFWKNLKEGKKCITEIPKERWNWEEYYGDPQKDDGKSNSKWGGFLSQVDQFDPMFFKISPWEAKYMDPCQRIFLEEAWHTFEDAGYMGDKIKNTSCGVYVGVEEGEYGVMVRQSGQYYSNQNAMLSARIAHALDLKGPNLSITASCSSSLVALHHACQAIRNGDCDMALAGGINLLVSPAVHVGMSLLDLLSPTGNSNVFDKNADGLVPAEAAAVVLLKPLSKAIRDNDQIYGCIKGSGVNYNGKGHGLMTPNPVRQAELINQVVDKYQIDPLKINYLISHSVGAQLGDAAEIEGLKKAFSKYTSDSQYCYIGSVKPLIGHTFAASGIVSLITMLKSMQDKTIIKLHNYNQSNESINFNKTPFIPNTNNQPWNGQNNEERLGAISTSANSGTNAFAVVEEYIKPEQENIPIRQTAQSLIFTFSATDQAQLGIVAEQYLKYLETEDAVSLSDMSYTLQLGREALAYRLAITATTKTELVKALKDYVSFVQEQKEFESSSSIYTGNTHENNNGTQNLSSQKYQEEIVKQFIEEDNFELLAIHWTKGGKVNWELLWQNYQMNKISLPGYPFRKERYWIETPSPEPQEEARSKEELPTKAEQNTSEEIIAYFLHNKLNIAKKQIKPNKYFQDYGVDSILMMKLVRELQQHYQFEVSIHDIIKYPTIGALATYLSQMQESGFQQETATVEANLEASLMTDSEYKNEEIIDAMEKYIEGAINLKELEKTIGIE